MDLLLFSITVGAIASAGVITLLVFALLVGNPLPWLWQRRLWVSLILGAAALVIFIRLVGLSWLSLAGLSMPSMSLPGLPDWSLPVVLQTWQFWTIFLPLAAIIALYIFGYRRMAHLVGALLALGVLLYFLTPLMAELKGWELSSPNLEWRSWPSMQNVSAGASSAWGSVQDMGKWIVLITFAIGALYGLLKSKLDWQEKLVGFGVWVLAFLLIGPLIVQKDWSEHSYPVTQHAYAPAGSAKSECNVSRREYYFSTSKPLDKFNPGGKCSPTLFVEGHCVYVTQNLSERVWGPICDRGDDVPRDKAGNRIAMPRDIDRAWSADGVPFRAEIALAPPRYESLVDIRR